MIRAESCGGCDWERERRSIDEHRPEPPMGSAACTDGLFGTVCGAGGEDAFVFVPPGAGRRASVGISRTAGHLYSLTSEGMNDAGLACCATGIGVESKGATGGTSPGKERLNAYMIVRLLLDRADSVSGAVRMLSEKDIYCSGRECHLLLCDRSRSAAVEFVDDRMTVTYGTRVLTDFYVSGFETDEGVRDHPDRLEAYRGIEKGLSSLDGAGSLSSLMLSASRSSRPRASVYDLDGLQMSVFEDGLRSDYALQKKICQGLDRFSLSANPWTRLYTWTGDSTLRNHNGPQDP